MNRAGWKRWEEVTDYTDSRRPCDRCGFRIPVKYGNGAPLKFQFCRDCFHSDRRLWAAWREGRNIDVQQLIA